MSIDLTCTTLAAVLAATLGAPVAAQAPVTTALPPEGCTVTLTVLAQSCLTSRYWTCPGDRPGHQWHGVVVDGVEAEVTLLDPAGNPVLTHYIEAAASVTLTDIADPGDLPALIAKGEDRFDYVRTGDDGRPPERYVGRMQLMGRLLTVDGHDLPQVYIDYEVFVGGAAVWSGSAVQYLSPDRTTLFYGNDFDAEGVQLTDYTPLRILTPGQQAISETCPG